MKGSFGGRHSLADALWAARLPEATGQVAIALGGISGSIIIIITVGRADEPLERFNNGLVTGGAEY